MSMGEKSADQVDLFVPHETVRRAAGHPFYEALEKVLREADFDRRVEKLCKKFYAERRGRPSIPPGVYFRCLMVGFFEGIDSERGIAWRVADSLSLRGFLGISFGKSTPDHSSLSNIRRRLDLETHQEVFTMLLGKLAEHGLVKGKSVGVDATTLEANAALRSLVRREDGQSYEDFLIELAKKSGIETPTREDLAKIDRKRKKKGSNEEWVNPHEPDAEIMKMKKGGTRMAHKHEHAVDLETGAILGSSLNGGARGDTKTLEETLVDADENLQRVREEADEETCSKVSETIEEVTADKGYHSNETLMAREAAEQRSYISEPKRGRRNWKNKKAERDAVYRNRKRLKRRKGKGLLRKRGELLERPMEHLFNSGGMRRTHLRHHENISKRLLIHMSAFNLGILMRELFGVGKPRRLQGRKDLLEALLTAFARFATILCVVAARLRGWRDVPKRSEEFPANFSFVLAQHSAGLSGRRTDFSTAC